MKRFTLLSLLTLAIPFILTGQNQNEIIDDVYFAPSIQAAIMKTNSNKAPEKQINNSPRPNYKNGAKEIVFKERQVKYPTIIRDTVFADGKSPDGYAIHSGNFDIKSYDGRTNPVYLHDTIYSEGTANIENDNENQESGHYLNGFNGSESDKEYAERIRRFHNPKYTIFIGDPRYNDIYFLNSSDWNVYVDDSYAYVTPTWTNPYWWNYSINPYGYGYGFGSWGHGWNSPYYGFGGMYNNWYGYDSFYGYGGMYGYGNYWDPYGYGYGGYYGYDNGYWGGSWVTTRNKNYDESNRRSTGNYSSSGNTRLGGTRSEDASSRINSGGLVSTSRNQYTVVSGSNTNSGYVSRSTSTGVNTRNSTSLTNGIGIVRNNFNRNFGSDNSTVRTPASGLNINTSPRTYTATSNSVPTSTYSTRDNGTSASTFRNSTSTVTRSSSSNSSVNPSRGNNYNGSTRSSSPAPSSYSSSSNSSSYSGSNSSYSGSSSSGSSSSGGGSRNSSSSGGRR